MKILVCGAGVAGLSATLYLKRAGHEVTTLETGPKLRTAGGPVDVRGDALDFVKELGLWDEMKAHEVHMTDDMYFIDKDGKKAASFPHNAIKDSPDDLEIERVALIPILAREAGIETFRFGTTIESLDDRGNHVHVKLTDGTEDDYDLVIGTDGVHSLTRKLAFGRPEADFAHFLGVYVGFAPIGPTGPEGTPSVNFNTPGKLIGCVQSRDCEYAVMMFRSPQLSYDYRDPAAIRDIIRNTYTDDLWRTQEMVERSVNNDGLWMDEATQIKMDSWRKGRVFLVGDSAHCATPLSGRGVSIAISGARFLTMALNEFPNDIDAAYARYEELQRPYVDHAQATVYEGIGIVLPESYEEIDARNEMVRQMMSEA
ncbi:hypothetical protein ASE00_01895 [Sphingomonas sp. Root710]|uniref:FAD-dependent monooxygenase n=1 Tax=Sphingomonas sp. Root710 TaxID=1736594 RepID=UPI0007008EC0|nr:FAD-dependent monooxygenase [Sphingomonas sp. Root710]KRB85572.1 hypothetical protein ASE00_01895 [Sphingomonas sp. Root710]